MCPSGRVGPVWSAAAVERVVPLPARAACTAPPHSAPPPRSQHVSVDHHLAPGSHRDGDFRLPALEVEGRLGGRFVAAFCFVPDVESLASSSGSSTRTTSPPTFLTNPSTYNHKFTIKETKQ